MICATLLYQHTLYIKCMCMSCTYRVSFACCIMRMLHICVHYTYWTHSAPPHMRIHNVHLDLYCHPHLNINSVSATILKKGRPAQFVSGWFAIMLTAAAVVCSMVVVPKCCGYLWLPTISSETHYKCGCTSVHSTCTHSRLCIHRDYPSAHCISL